MRIIILLVVIVQASLAQTIPGQYPIGSQRALTLTDIDSMSEKSLRIMRNEIFARYGMIFKSADLTAHFSKTNWYKGTSADVTAKLTDIEKKNIDFLRNQEARIKAYSDFEEFYDTFRNAILKDDLAKLMKLVHTDLMSEEGLRQYWSLLKKAAAANPILDHEEDYALLTYDTRNDGTTQDFLVFKKIGPCWYIVGFDGIG